MPHTFEYREEGFQCWLEAIAPNVNTDQVSEEKGLWEQARFEVYRVTNESRVRIGAFSFSPMPGCCGAVVSHFTLLEPSWRGGGMSGWFRKIKDKVAVELGYSMVIMTTQMHNIPAVKNMFNRGFKVADTFTNKRTNNLLALGYKKV